MTGITKTRRLNSSPVGARIPIRTVRLPPAISPTPGQSLRHVAVGGANGSPQQQNVWVIDPRRWALLAVLVGLLAACGEHVSPPSGVLSGFATPCVGAMTHDQYASVPMRLTVMQGAQTVMTQTVQSPGAYRFVLLQGKYEVSLDQSSVSASGFAFTVSVHAGEVTNLNLFAHCK
jgi:hypothetical protein